MDNDSQQPAQGTPPPRRFGASRVRPRVEVSRKPPVAQPVSPELEAPYEEPLDAGTGGPHSTDPFGPRTFAGGRVRVYGCSPGCLIASLVISLILTLLLNAIF